MASASHQTQWKIMIIDDHPLLRTGLATLIEAEPDMVVSGEAGTVSEAIRVVQETPPDLAIVDISLGDGSGLELIRHLRAINEQLNILVCSMHDEALFARRALRAGARGYISKAEATDHIIDALRRVTEGKIWLSEQISEGVLRHFAEGNAMVPGHDIERLSNREIEVFSLIGKGVGATEIASQLHLSVKTIETHRAHIKRKLNLRSSHELARRALMWVLEH